MVQIKGNWMIYIIVASVIAGSLYLSMSGALWATNIIIGILCLNVFLVIYSIAIVVGFQKTLLKNPEKRIEELKAFTERSDARTLILIRILLLLGVWHLYTLGYVLFAGITATTVIISIMIVLFRSIDMIEEKKE
jgi:hypothetical protein